MAAAEIINYIPAGPVVTAFHQSQAFVRGLMGPVGSSKSSACFWELVNAGFKQKADKRGRRRVRHLVVRQTYPELKSTTIATCMEWMPLLKMRWDSPITGELIVPLKDGTVSEQEFVFLAVERPDDVKKLKSFEATFAWLNEAAEIHFEAFTKAIERTGRFPKGDQAAITREFVIADTNPPDTDSWWYNFFEEKKFDIKREDGSSIDVAIFRQPGGLIEVDGKFIANPKAENIAHLNGGYDYYFKQLLRTKDEIRVFLCGQYGTVTTGKPVYKDQYNDDMHCKPTTPNPKLPLIIGWDFGLGGSAAIICQVNKEGQLVVLDECVSADMGVDEFGEDVVKLFLAQKYRDYEIRHVGDPAGMHRSTNEAKTCFQTLAEVGFALMPALTNDPTARIEATRRFMTRSGTGGQKFVIDPECSTTRKALMGKYCFERMQVSGPERFRDKPVKNHPWSDVADALGYAALHVSQIELNTWKSDKKQYYVPMAIA